MEQTDSIVYMTWKLKYMQVKLFRKIKELVKADDLATAMIDEVSGKLPKSEGISEVSEPKAYWKFALYASYIQAVILSDNCEQKLPR